MRCVQMAKIGYKKAQTRAKKLKIDLFMDEIEVSQDLI
mgnify:CR=1 FL=1